MNLGSTARKRLRTQVLKGSAQGLSINIAVPRQAIRSGGRAEFRAASRMNGLEMLETVSNRYRNEHFDTTDGLGHFSTL